MFSQRGEVCNLVPRNQISLLGYCEIQGFYRTGKFDYFLSKMQLSSSGDHISVVFSVKLPLKLIWLKVSSAFNLGQGQQWNFPSLVMWCMMSASQWKFPATQLALYTCHSGWLELAEAGENRFNRD